MKAKGKTRLKLSNICSKWIKKKIPTGCSIVLYGLFRWEKLVECAEDNLIIQLSKCTGQSKNDGLQDERDDDRPYISSYIDRMMHTPGKSFQ